MAPPPTGASAGDHVPVASAGDHVPVAAPPEPTALRVRDSKSRRPRARPAAAGAGARILSLGVQAAVMAAALALFVLFAAAAAVLLLVLVVAARAFRHHHRSRYRVPSLGPSPPPTSPPRAGLSPAGLRLLPSFAFSSPRGAQGPSVPPHLCAVCLEAARGGERWRALPACGHAFHAACVDQWLAKSPACPLCRAAVAVSLS